MFNAIRNLLVANGVVSDYKQKENVYRVSALPNKGLLELLIQGRRIKPNQVFETPWPALVYVD